MLSRVRSEISASDYVAGGGLYRLTVTVIKGQSGSRYASREWVLSMNDECGVSQRGCDQGQRMTRQCMRYTQERVR